MGSTATMLCQPPGTIDELISACGSNSWLSSRFAACRPPESGATLYASGAVETAFCRITDREGEPHSMKTVRAKTVEAYCAVLLYGVPQFRTT